jgi:hypothetical protein
LKFIKLNINDLITLRFSDAGRPGGTQAASQQFIEALGATKFGLGCKPSDAVESSTRHDIIYDAHIGCPQRMRSTFGERSSDVSGNLNA